MDNQKNKRFFLNNFFSSAFGDNHENAKINAPYSVQQLQSLVHGGGFETICCVSLSHRGIISHTSLTSFIIKSQVDNYGHSPTGIRTLRRGWKEREGDVRDFK